MSGQPRGRSRNRSAPLRFDEVTSDERRRMMVFAALRSLAFAAIIVAAYFTLPLTRPGAAGPIARVVVGMIVIAAALTFQIRATMRSPFPGMRAFEALAISGPLFLILFATTHYLIEHNNAHSYSQAMTRLDALYFTFTVLTTVGFGDIAPVSELARTITMLQMVGDLLLIFVVARVLFGAVKVGMERRGRPTGETAPPDGDAASRSPERHRGPGV
jgi:voltage-gated potassium channel